MIKFIASSDGKKNLIGLGLSHDNLELLKKGLPISFPANELLYGSIKQITPEDTFFIFSDTDEKTMGEKLKEILDVSKTEFREFNYERKTPKDVE